MKSAFIITLLLGGTFLHVLNAQPSDTLALGRYLRNTIEDPNHPIAEKDLQHILTVSRKLNYDYGMVCSLKLLGNIYTRKGDFNRAWLFYEEGLSLCDTTGETRLYLATFENNLASIYQLKNNLDQAAIHYQQAIFYHERYSSTMSLSKLYNNYAVILNQNRQFGRALVYLQKAISQLQDDKFLATLLINKGSSFHQLKQWDSAQSVLEQALQLTEKYHNDQEKANVLLSLSKLYLEKKQPSKAIDHALQVLNMKLPYISYSMNPYLYLAEGYYDLRSYEKAEYYSLKSYSMATEHGNMASLVDIHSLLATIYANNGNFEKAYEHQQLFKDLYDSLNDTQKAKDISLLEIKYRTAQKDKDIAEKQLFIREQERSLNKKNNLILLITSGAFILLILLAAVYRSYINKQKIQRKQWQILKQQQEISELKAIMSGEEKERVRLSREIHDSIMIQFSIARLKLSAALGKPDESIRKDDFDGILSQLDKGTSELRNTAHNLMPDILLEAGIIEALDNFCSNLQRSSAMEIELQAYGDLPRQHVQFELAVYRIIQELIQNIIKHSRANHAIIQISSMEDRLQVVVEDNGVGMEKDIATTEKGMGLKSIFARVRVLDGTIEIESKKDIGTTITLEFSISAVEQHKEMEVWL